MTYNLYSIRDVKTSFMAPHVDMNDETAKRNFAMMVSNNPGVIGFQPKDFDLYYIGLFDIDKGIVIPESIPNLICNGEQVVKGKEDET